MTTKAFYLSKTFWLNVLVLLSLVFPAVKDWVAANPQTFSSVWAACNVLLSVITGRRLTLFSDSADSPGPGMTPVWLMTLVGTAIGFVGSSLSSCSPAGMATIRAWPIKSCVLTDAGTVCYSSKSGLEVTVDATSQK
jgi:hypothetical protein